MNKIFITGGSGFISSHFHEVLAHDTLTNFDLKSPIEGIKSKYIKGDIRNEKEISKAVNDNKCDIILALAAEHKDFGISREAYFKTNEEGTKNICRAASKAGIDKIIFYSSVAVYGNNSDPSNEEMTPNPNMPYGESKLAGEEVLKAWAKENSNRSVLIIRPVVVYGERNVANMFRLIQQIKAGRYFHIGKGSNIKSIAYVKNLVDATLFLSARMKPGVEIYNYADEPHLSSREIASFISKNLGKNINIKIPYFIAILLGLPFDILIKITKKDLPISTGRIKKFCTETWHMADKIRRVGFEPKYSNIQGLDRMVQWQQNEYDIEQNYFDI